METGITFTFAAIFLGAAVLSSVALYARQPIIIAYIALGVALGPFGLKVVSDTELVSDAGHVGIIFLLFLLGLDMKLSALWNSLVAVHSGRASLRCCLRHSRLWSIAPI